MQNIIFLDIDGPLIPTISYLFDLHASINQNLNLQCVNILKKIIEKSGAKIVLNTTHNHMLHERISTEGKLVWPGLLNKFKEVGLYEHLRDENFHTNYPNAKNRLSAINTWLDQNGNAIWVALDDAYIDHPNAYLIDQSIGIDLRAYNFCAEKFNFKSLFVAI